MSLVAKSTKKNRTKFAIAIKSSILNLFYSPIGRLIPDKPYLKAMYFLRMRKKLNLNNPVTLNEKLQWLKLYDRKPIYSEMVDKYAAKEYAANLIGREHIIPTIGVWDTFDEIDIESLPEQFVLKCTHDSGGLVICRDKARFNNEAARVKIESSLKRKFFYVGREWPYKNVKPRIIAEPYMVDGEEDENNIGLVDYKFFCFHGKPKFLYVSQNLTNHDIARISFVSLEWENEPFWRNDYTPFEELPVKPTMLDQMAEYASVLAKGHRFLRVDLYQINGEIYFSEFTFTPCNGMIPFEPSEWDVKLGELLELAEEESCVE